MAEPLIDAAPRTGDRRGTAAVIGSGFGGLGAAIRLQAAGVQVTLYEARDLPGGRAYVYRDQGYTFDAGPTVITAPHCLEELYACAGRKLSDHVELMPVSPFYRLLWSGEESDPLDYAADFEQVLRARFPDDVEGYQRFVQHSRAAFTRGYEELSTAPFLRFGDMLRAAPDLVRLRADRSVYTTVARHVKNEKLREALSFHTLLVGGNPFETSSIYTLIHWLERKWGVFFPRGGTGELVQQLVRLFTSLGGELRLSSAVRDIEVDQAGRHRVRTDGRAAEIFDLVVSNADVHHTYAKLYGARQDARQKARRLEQKQWSMSLFVLYFGASRTWPGLAHHTVLFGPRYKGLLRDVFHGSALPDDFSLYLHAPSVTDPSLAPPGCSSFYVLSPVPHLGQAAIDWAKEGPRYADRLLASLEQRLLPGLRQSLVTQRHFTPVDFREQLNAHQGSAFSLAPVLTQSAWFRPHNRDGQMPNLYLVGAGTHPGAGLPGVLSSAKATADLILADLAAREAA